MGPAFGTYVGPTSDIVAQGAHLIKTTMWGLIFRNCVIRGRPFSDYNLGRHCNLGLSSEIVRDFPIKIEFVGALIRKPLDFQNSENLKWAHAAHLGVGRVA